MFSPLKLTFITRKTNTMLREKKCRCPALEALDLTIYFEQICTTLV